MLARPLDGTIITELEVQMPHFLGASPIASIKHVGPNEVEGAGDRLPTATGEKQEQLVAHPLANEIEKFARQIRPAPLPRAGVLVEGPHGVPFGGTDVGASQRPDFGPFPGCGSVLADALALAAAKRGEEFVEARIAAIEPVILDTEAAQPPAPLAFGCTGFIDEGDMRR